MIVVDSDIIAARNLTTVLTPCAERVEKRDSVWIVPPLWRYEFQNILVKALCTRQLALDSARVAWACAMDQLAANEHEPSPERVIELSNSYRITGYGANFIALAMEMDVPCVTEDGGLHAKCPGVAVSMNAFLEGAHGSGAVRAPHAAHRTGKRRENGGGKVNRNP